jgi:hypothetical protein
MLKVTPVSKIVNTKTKIIPVFDKRDENKGNTTLTVMIKIC